MPISATRHTIAVRRHGMRAMVKMETIAPIVKAVAAHRRSCFRGERLVQAAIDGAATIADIEAIDIQQHFATAYQQAFTEVMASA